MIVKNIKRIFCSLFLAVFCLTTSISTYAHHDEGQEYNLLEEVYMVFELTEAEKYGAANQKLEQVIIALDTGHLSVSDEKLAYVTDLANNTMRHLDSDIDQHDLKVDKVLSFVLTIESVTNPQNQVVSHWEERLEKRIYNGLESESRELEKNFFQVMDLYSVVYPAFKVKQDPEVWNELDQQYININKVHTEEDMLSALHVMLQTFENLEVNQNTEEEDDDASFGWLILSVGGVIIFTLIYVGWRKYKGEKKQRKAKNVDDI